MQSQVLCWIGATGPEAKLVELDQSILNNFSGFWIQSMLSARGIGYIFPNKRS